MSHLSHFPVLRGPTSYLPGTLVPSLPVLQDQLGGFRSSVCKPGQDFDKEDGRRALDKLAAQLDFTVVDDSAGTYRQLLLRLDAWMSGEMRQRDASTLAVSGSGYAAVVAAMSKVQPEIDYSAPIGQLLEVMARLFSEREKGWKDIYKCLRSVPDSVAAKQALTRVCLAEIREWFDAGVQNLFSLQEQLAGQVAEVREKVAGIEQRLADRRQAQNVQQVERGGSGKVTNLSTMVVRREIRTLEQQLAEKTEELDGRQSTLNLIESDIADFEQILHAARRTYRLQVV